MKTYDPNDKWDRDEADHLGAEQWMLDLLSLNPSYPFWGPGDDYMKGASEKGGWDAGIEFQTWKDFNFQLDELNECVNFYFQVRRASKECTTCDLGILIETRAKRLGVWGRCLHCGGRGYVFTEPTAHASVVLWMIHPQKGCSRGVEVLHLDQEDVPKVRAWLGKASKRNVKRFSKAVE